MYVTRPLSRYRKCPSTLSIPPPDAPSSGYLVITDEEAQAEDTYCWGLCKRRTLKKLPFPSDKIFKVVYSSQYGETVVTKVWFIPVLGQPLSSNLYYVVRAKGRFKGQVCTCSREEDMGLCCFSNVIVDLKPKPFNYRDMYQHMKIHRYHENSFFAKSVAPHDGVPPKFLRRKGWQLKSSSVSTHHLREALGLDSPLRERLPDFNFPMSSKRSGRAIVGRWYCPFIFVREEGRVLKKQMSRSMVYSMTLEQWWEEIYGCENDGKGGNQVHVDEIVEREVARVYGKVRGVKDPTSGHGGFLWYRGEGGRGIGVGLSSAIVETMRMVEEEGGWVGGRERGVRVRKGIQITSDGDGDGDGDGREWVRFGCYVLVESFVLRRLDGSLVLNVDYRHTHRVKCKLE